MKKRNLIALLLMLLLASCNLPAGQPASPTPDLIATQVATLSTLPPVETPTDSSPGPTDTGEPAAVTATPLPSPTPLPPTAITSPEDPRLQLGNPTFTDTLDNGKSFGLESKAYDDDYTYIRVENGALVLTSRYATGYHGWRTGGTKLGDAYLEATVHVGECAGADTYGLIFRSPDFIKGYRFQVTCDGKWSLGYWDGNDYTLLKDGASPSGAMLTGANQTNRLGVWTSGSQIKLYINGQLINESEDATFTEPGSFGAVIASNNTPNLTVTIDEFTYWILD